VHHQRWVHQLQGQRGQQEGLWQGLGSATCSRSTSWARGGATWRAPTPLAKSGALAALRLLLLLLRLPRHRGLTPWAASEEASQGRGLPPGYPWYARGSQWGCPFWGVQARADGPMARNSSSCSSRRGRRGVWGGLGARVTQGRGLGGVRVTDWTEEGVLTGMRGLAGPEGGTSRTAKGGCTGRAYGQGQGQGQGQEQGQGQGQGQGLREGRESPRGLPAQGRHRGLEALEPGGESEGNRGKRGSEWRSEKGSVSGRVGDRGVESDRGKNQRGANVRLSPEGESYSDRGEPYNDREYDSPKPELDSDWEPVAKGRDLRDQRSPGSGAAGQWTGATTVTETGTGDRDQYSDRKGRSGNREGESDRELGRELSGLERRVDRALDALDSASASSDDVAEAIDFLQAALREDPSVQCRVLEWGGVPLVVDAMESRDSAVVEGAAAIVLTLCETWEGGKG